MTDLKTNEQAGTSSDQADPILRLEMDPSCFFSFFPILLRGFKVKVQNGVSIAGMLTEQYGLTLEYIEDRIRCIFLNGTPADDVETNTLDDGSTLALCDAVPGLAGCTMRRDAPHLRTMRTLSAHELEKKGLTEGEGVIHVKLFNMMVRELGPIFLNKGIWIRGEDLDEFLWDMPRDFWTGCREAKVNGQEVDKQQVLQTKWSGKSDLVFMSVGLDSRR